MARPGASPETRAVSDEAADADISDDRDPDCPLCPGNESMTPPETWADRPDGSTPDSPGWLVRSVPNLYPAVTGEGMRHEVVVTSPSHSRDIPDLGSDEVERAVRGWAERLRHFFTDDAVEFAQAFVNAGPFGGASLRHPHAQLVGLNLIPPVGEAEAASLGAADGCPICDLALTGEKIFSNDLGFAACPPWSEFPYEVLIAPSGHISRFENDSDATALVTPFLVTCLRAVTVGLGIASFNVIVHTAPALAGPDGFHWHLHLYPRIGTFAGIELGAGLPVNIVDPGEATAAIRAR